MTTFIKDVSDIPSLKPPQETFVDEPKSFDEINFDELSFDLNNKLKNISNLNVLHLLYIMDKMCRMIIKLQSNPHLFKQFRTQQLKQLKIQLEDDEIEDEEIEKSPLEKISSSDYINKPLKLTKFNDASFENINDDDIVTKDQNQDIPSSHPPYIPIETLILDTTIRTSTIDLKNEIKLSNKQKQSINQNELQQHKTYDFKNIFNLIKIPSLSILQFLTRIKTYSPNISNISYLQSIFLIYKITIVTNSIKLTMNNVYRIIVGSLRCCIKLFDDVYQKQKIFCNVVGLSLKDLFKVEINFLYLLNFNMYFYINNDDILNNFLSIQFNDLCEFMKMHFTEFYEVEIRN